MCPNTWHGLQLGRASKPLKIQRKFGLQSFIINNGTAPISAVFEEEQTCKHDGWNKAGSEWYSHWIAGREEVEAAGGQVTVLALKPGSNPDRP